MPIKHSWTIESNVKDDRTIRDKTCLNPFFKRSNQTLNPWFNVNGEIHQNNNETDLFSSLISESIEIMGVFATYIIRTNKNIDYTFGDTLGANYKYSFPLAVRYQDTGGYASTVSLQANFGFMAGMPVTLVASYDKVVREITKLQVPIDQNYIPEGSKSIRQFPQPGDLIWLNTPEPKAGRLFEIQYADDDFVFFQGGKRMVYTFTCQLFDMGSETFSIEDKVFPEATEEDTDHPLNQLLDEKYDKNYIEHIMDNEDIKTELNQRKVDIPDFWSDLLK